jgi:hypothetical protein
MNHPEICPLCGGDDIDTPDTAETFTLADGRPGLRQWTVCNDGECQGSWDAVYVFVENVNQVSMA